jgi:hypothetical protein
MQRLDRNSWIMLVGSIVVAVALVTLIPYYGLVGGHQEHGVIAAGPLSASSHRYVILPDGVDMVMTAESDTDTATITAIQTHMQDEAARFRAGDYGDDMAMVSADLIAALRDHQAEAAQRLRQHTDQADEEDGSVTETLERSQRTRTHALHQAHHGLAPRPKSSAMGLAG